MKKYDIRLTCSAAADLDGIPKEQRIKVIASLNKISSDPFSAGPQIKKLKGFRPPLYRARSGDFRILYKTQESTLIILRVINRKDLETIIKRLKL